MLRAVATLVVLAFVLAAAAGPVQAQVGGPSVPPGLTEPPPEQAGRTDFDDDDGLSMLQLGMIIGGAGLVLGTIAWFIVRDAHRVAPVGSKWGKKAKKGGAGGGGGSRAAGGAGSNGVGAGSVSARSAANAERARERQKAKRAKAKARAARQQRKQNRPR
ncbi:MAG: hypothetical protein Q8O56_04935 [Solirubrobacteraceae bacterium]|nr:hypothetical protein [Solirubrobacteraceae bacterium]